MRFTIPPDVTHVFGGYWDVYRLSFLSGKRVVGHSLSDVSQPIPGLVPRARAGAW